MMMTLRGKEKSFHIGDEPFHELVERYPARRRRDSFLFLENPLRMNPIISIGLTLQNEIEAVNGCARRREKSG